MRIITEGSEINGYTAVALGTFDGIHRAHQEIISRARMLAEENGMESLVYTFDGIPSNFFSQGERYLFSRSEKISFISDMGIDLLSIEAFDEKIADMEAEDFLYILRTVYKARIIVCGFNYRFGRGRKGDIGLLQTYAKDHDMKIYVIPEMRYGGKTVSSTAVRKLVENGDMEEARDLLGHSYYFTGDIVDGRRVGRTIGFPTINLSYDNGKVLPPLGVYASLVEIDERIYSGVTNIGMRPTVGNGDDITFETNILDFSGDVYGKKAKVTLEKLIRRERKFSSLDELKEQIGKDKKTADDYLKENSPAISE